MPERELREVFTAVFGCAAPAGNFGKNTLEEWDSLGHVKLVLELEARFGVRVAPADIARLHADFGTVLAYMDDATQKIPR
jgi:acyl carrier protein